MRMKSPSFLTAVALTAVTLAAATSAHARPRVIEEAQWLAAPDDSYRYFAQSVAIDGDWALATALQSADGSFNYPYRQLALLYRRTNGAWAFDRVLVNDTTDENSWNEPKVAMREGLAAVSTSPLRAFRLNGGSWVAQPNPFTAPPGDTAWANGLTRIDGTTIAAIAGRCNAGAVTSDHLSGAWTAPRTVIGNPRICSLPNYSGSMDVDGNRLVVSNPQEDSDYPPSSTYIYGRSAPGAAWQLEGSLAAGEYGFGVSVLGNEIIIGSWHPLGNDVYRQVDGVWQHTGHLPALTGHDPYYEGAGHVARGGGYVLVPTSRHDGTPAGVAVYQRNASGAYEHVAQLQASNGDALGPVVEISGRTVIVSAVGDTFDEGRLYFFELPPSLRAARMLQDDFENGADRWAVHAGQFEAKPRTWSRVFYQSYLGNGASAVLSGSEMDNQSVEADVRPRGFSGADRWVGLATRYDDSSNYYHVTLRSSGQVQLRRVLGGVSQVLDSAPFPVAVNRTYRVRLESIGSHHRVFIDDEPLLEARDHRLARGHVALLTYRASADFDEVVITPNARSILYDNSLDGTYCRQFIRDLGPQQTDTPEWDCEDYDAGYLRQASDDGIARTVLPTQTEDQAVESRLMAESFAATSSQDKWLGVIARYRSENDYYYLTLRSSNAVSLRKLVNGQITELDTATFNVAPGNWHTLRLEVVGERLRGYVDGTLMLQAVDSSHPVGSAGIATWRTVGRFDNLRVAQP
jgi:hypothetical protein